jgi:murein DD-endopeptidase MepM/ murein hydrolase activator NlpD
VLLKKIKEFLSNSRLGTPAVRDRVRKGLAGRSRQVVAMATLAGVAAIGLAAATLDNTPAETSAALSADAHNERLAALDRANRAIRESASPQALATPTQSAPPSAAAPATTSAPAATKKAPAWVNPMPAGQISSCFGQRWGVLHAGVDLYTDAGEPIVSVGAGEVVAAGWAYSGYGISVVVDHGNGYLTHYAHMQADAVSVGQWVKAGDVLGYEGSTGDSTGPHLHFEVHAGMWNQIEPAQWLRDRGVDIGGC